MNHAEQINQLFQAAQAGDVDNLQLLLLLTRNSPILKIRKG